MQAALASGDTRALSEAQTEMVRTAAAQRETRAEMLASREALSEAEHEQDEVFAAMTHHKHSLDARRARRARAVAEAQTDIQEAQEEVMRRARAMSAALDVLPEDAPADASWEPRRREARSARSPRAKKTRSALNLASPTRKKACPRSGKSRSATSSSRRTARPARRTASGTEDSARCF